MSKTSQSKTSAAVPMYVAIFIDFYCRRNLTSAEAYDINDLFVAISERRFDAIPVLLAKARQNVTSAPRRNLSSSITVRLCNGKAISVKR